MIFVTMRVDDFAGELLLTLEMGYVRELMMSST